MSKLGRLGAMLVAMTFVTACAISMADAQDKPKDTKKPVEKAPEKAAEKPGKIEIYKAKDGYRYRILDADGKTIAMASKSYDKEEEVVKVLEQVKATLIAVKIEVKDEKKEDKKP